MNLSDMLTLSIGDIVPGMRQGPRRLRRLQGGATGEWDPYDNGPVAPPQPPISAVPLASPMPIPPAFRKGSPRSPIDDPRIPIPSGTGMIRNTRTGEELRLEESAPTQPPGPELDYSRPMVDVFGQGKGRYLKNDPMSAVVNGNIVHFGRDTAKEGAMTSDGLKAEEARQRLRKAEVDIALKQQRLNAKPKAPPNYRWTEDGNLERIPGGAADEKVVSAFHADSAGVRSATAAIDNLLGVANLVLTSPGLEGNYGLLGVFPNMPGGKAADAKALIQRLKDVSGFSALNELKSAGNNGSSGLGAVTEFEHKLLQNQLANLDKAQSVDQVRSEIANLVRATEASKQRLSNYYRNRYGKMIDDSALGLPNPLPTESNPPAPSAPEFAGKTSFNTLPDPTRLEGRIIRDSHTGQRLKAVKGVWEPVKE